MRTKPLPPVNIVSLGNFETTSLCSSNNVSTPVLSDLPLHNLHPSFIVPKADPKAIPCWVCDYRQLNDNTVPDNFPLPRVDDILADCAKGKIWATIDMTDSFFQTRMHESDIHKTAVTTPFGSYEWCVMPMGFRNSPAIHQRRVTNALREHLGKICHVY